MTLTDLEKRIESLKKTVGPRFFDSNFDEEGRYCPQHETNFVDMCDMALDIYDSMKNKYQKAVNYIMSMK